MAKLDIVIGAVDKASGTLDKVGGKAGKMGKLLAAGAVAGAAGLGAVGVASLKMGLDFEKSMAEVKTLMPDISEKAFGKMKSDVLDLSKEMGIATTEAVPALYQAISAGVPKENVADFMTIASKAAIGGVTDLETAVDGITSITNAYGLENVSAQKAADVMFNAVKAGKTDFNQLSTSLFNVIPTASSLGISFEDVTSQLASLTAQGVPTAVATTQMRAAMVEASKGGTKLDTAIKALAGKSFPELISEGKTMPEIFESLRGSMPEQEFKDLFGSVEAMNSVLGVTGPNFEKTSAIFDDAKNSAGDVDAAFDTMSQTASFKLNKAINYVKVSLTELGAKALPYVIKGVEEAGKFVQDKLIPPIKEFWSTHGPAIIATLREVGGYLRDFFAPALDTLADLWANVLKPALEAILPILKKVGEFLLEHKPILIAIAAAILLLVAPWLAVVAAIAIVLAKWDEISAFFTGIGETIKGFVTGAIETVLGIPIIGDIVRDTFNAIQVYVETYLNVVILFIETALETIKNTFAFWKAVFTGDWDAAWTAVKDQFGVIMNLLSGLFGIALDAVQALLASKLEMLKGIGTDIGNAILGALESALDIPGILWGMVTDFWKWIGEKGSQLLQIGKTIGEWIWDGIKGAFGSITDLIPDLNPTGINLGLGVGGFQHGGFVPPGVVMPAILHGGAHGEDVIPRGRGGAGGVNIYGNITVVTQDPEDFMRQLRRYAAA